MTTLNEQITDLHRQLMNDLTPDTRRVLQRAMQRVYDSGIETRVPTVGDRFPKFTLPNALGGSVSSVDLLEDGPLVVCFYRGGWCPYCSLELRAYQDLLAEIRAAGGNFVAISPQLPDDSLTTAQKLELNFDVLSDTGNSLAQHLNLSYSLSDEVKERYLSFGYDLERINGDPSWTLPMPATFVIGRDGLIKSSYAHADYSLRQDPAEILETLKELAA